ncbi:MAG: sodium:solute symporter [Chromatiales bacterium 21-64-14]|nr:MAG: sodium:solute symporter [Chromatiales bacterium 21-64-14]HQU16068.1 sodium:solute symporter [Gammaproteobacteria bacterium]
MNWIAFSVFAALFIFVTLLGFVAARWRRGDLDQLDEWGLAGRRFGTVVTWFLLGGDLYTAYTFIAVPALVFGAGAIGFFALPYTIVVYPLVLVVFPRLWSVAHRHGYVTAADFVQGRYDSHVLALLVAITGILATMPYIALQLVGIEVVIAAMGLGGKGLIGDLPLIVAFGILAAYTYTSGLRAPAIIAVVKDALIFITVIAAVIIIPSQLGGYAHIFASVSAEKLILPVPPHGSWGSYSAYASLALGSALTLFLYPHSVTGVLSASSRRAIRRNAALLPAYTVLLGLIALLGYMAVVSGVDRMPEFVPYFKQYGANFAVPALFLHAFPAWFVGLAFAAIAIGALVPAAIMSIAAANLFTRNVYRPYLRPNCTALQECTMAKRVSLVVKVGALAFVLFLPLKYAIQLQLLGGIWIIQTLPAIMIGLYTRWLHRWALVLGWAAGMVSGTLMVAALHFKGTVYPLHFAGITAPGYAAVYALIVNLVVAVLATPLLGVLGISRGTDRTVRPAAA